MQMNHFYAHCNAMAIRHVFFSGNVINFGYKLGAIDVAYFVHNLFYKMLFVLYWHMFTVM